MYNLYHGKIYHKNLGYFCNKKILKVNNRPIGENSPNLATLLKVKANCTKFNKLPNDENSPNLVTLAVNDTDLTSQIKAASFSSMRSDGLAFLVFKDRTSSSRSQGCQTFLCTTNQNSHKKYQMAMKTYTNLANKVPNDHEICTYTNMAKKYQMAIKYTMFPSQGLPELVFWYENIPSASNLVRIST
jgi:hypothetical protein